MSRTYSVLSAISMGTLALVLAWSSTVEAQQQQAGVAAAVRGRVEIAMTAGAVGRDVKSGEPIFLGNAIKSGPDSGMQILLLDQTTFTIGANSEITIDQFVYDPASGSGKVAASVAKGVFRFVTGKVAQTNPTDMTVRLPSGTIGIRGTIAAGSVTPGADGQPLKQEVVLLGPGSGREGSARVGSLLLTGGSGGSVAITQPGFGSQLGQGNTWGTPVRYTPEMLAALQNQLDGTRGGQSGQGGQGTGGGAIPPSQNIGQPLLPPPPGSALGQLGFLGPQGLSSIQAAGAQDQQRCEDTNACGGTGLIANGSSTFEQLRTISSGSFLFSQNNVAMDDLTTYNISVNINFGNRTIGGGSSNVQVSGELVNGTIPVAAQSFAAGSGTATFTQSESSALSGSMCSGSCTSNLSMTPQNAAGTIAAKLAHTLSITGVIDNSIATITGSGTTGTRTPAP